MLAALQRAGVDIRPEAMGVTWDDAGESLRTLAAYVRSAGLWFSVVDAVPIDEPFIARMRDWITSAYDGWGPEVTA